MHYTQSQSAQQWNMTFLIQSNRPLFFFNVKIGGQVYGLMSIKGERRILHFVESLFKLGLSIDAIQWGGMQNDGHSFFISYNVKIRASSVKCNCISINFFG